MQGATREAYEALQTAFPELEDISSIYLAQKTVARLSGLNLKYIDCCVNTCCCYAGKYAEQDRCLFPDCNEPRRDECGQSKKKFQYLPIIPRLISLFLDKATAEKMAYQHTHCEVRRTEDVTNVFDSALYRELCEEKVTTNSKEFSHQYFSDR